MSRTCKRYDARILSYVAGELEPEAIKGLESHLSECLRCRETLEQARLYVERVSLRPEPDGEAIRRLREGVRARISRRRRAVRLSWGIGIAAAASVLAVVGLWFMRSGKEPVVAPQAGVTHQQVAVLPEKSSQIAGTTPAAPDGLVIHGVPGTLPRAPGKLLPGGYREGAEEQLILLKKRYYTLLNVPIEKRDLDAFAMIAGEANQLAQGYPRTQEGLKAKNLQVLSLEQAGEERKARAALKEYLAAVDSLKGRPEGIRIARVKAEESMRSGDFRRALWLIAVARERYTDDREVKEWAAYREADCYMRMGRSKRAQELLASFRKEHSGKDEWSRKAQISLAYVHLKENDREKAVKLLEDYVKKYPDDALAAYAQFSLGWIYQVERKPELAILEYRKVIAKYPESAWTDKARVHLAKLEEQVLKGMEPVLK